MAWQENSFLLQEGKVNKTSGTISGVVICVTDGDLIINWLSGNTDTISCVAGTAYNLKNATSATVSSGMFHEN